MSLVWDTLLNIALFSAWNNRSLVHQSSGKLVSFATLNSSFFWTLPRGAGTVTATSPFWPTPLFETIFLHMVLGVFPLATTLACRRIIAQSGMNASVAKRINDEDSSMVEDAVRKLITDSILDILVISVRKK